MEGGPAGGRERRRGAGRAREPASEKEEGDERENGDEAARDPQEDLLHARDGGAGRLRPLLGRRRGACGRTTGWAAGRAAEERLALVVAELGVPE